MQRKHWFIFWVMCSFYAWTIYRSVLSSLTKRKKTFVWKVLLFFFIFKKVLLVENCGELLLPWDTPEHWHILALLYTQQQSSHHPGYRWRVIFTPQQWRRQTCTQYPVSKSTSLPQNWEHEVFYMHRRGFCTHPLTHARNIYTDYAWIIIQLTLEPGTFASSWAN